MNDETVVEVLRGAREAATKLIAMLEVENGYHPVSTVQIAKYQLLVSEIRDAIRYLEDEERCITTCDGCGAEVIRGTDVYCGDCREH